MISGNVTAAQTAAAMVNVSPANYPTDVPFDPDERYLEYPMNTVSPKQNYVYRSIRHLFFEMGLDRRNFGTSLWNPLGGLVRPGEHVLLKPNWVLHSQYKSHSIECLVTHGSVIRAVLDYVLIALQGKGFITIYDTPLMDANFADIIASSGVEDVVKALRGCQNVPIEIIDGRTRVVVGGKGGHTIREERQKGDPRGYIEFNLGNASMLHDLHRDSHLFAVGKGEETTMRRAHNAEDHKYLFPVSALSADVVIGMPKLKTHIKTGVTLALKNMVGLVGDKSYMPHFRRGGSARGGDEYEGYNWFLEVRDRLASGLRSRGRVVWGAGRLSWALLRTLDKRYAIAGRDRNCSSFDLKSGSWPGNDTLWRTIFDINRILLYGDREGRMHEEQQRRYFCVMDGVIAGEGDGPLTPDPVTLGVLLCSFNPIALDLACLRVMGYDYQRIKKIKNAFDCRFAYPLVDFEPADVQFIGDMAVEKRPFKEPVGWKGVLASAERACCGVSEKR